MQVVKARLPVLSLAACLFCAPAVADDATLEESRTLARSLGQQLVTELTAALEQGGAANAIDVCRLRAPAIAESLSLESGATVGRVSRRNRNPGNEPVDWQVSVLEQFEDEIAAGTPQPEYFAEEEGEARYMLAIRAQPMCLLCHGSNLGEDVRAALEQHYPDDTATGYDVGDLRGAFSVVWPVAGAEDVD